MEPTDEQLAAIAEVLYRLDAPRYGNDIRPFDEMAAWEQRKFVELARVAVTQWERLRSP
jgi:pyruvate-formate lyase